jgi:serine/threonine protein kinase
MIFESPDELRERIESLSGRKVYGRVVVTEDTSDYMGIQAGTVLRLGGSDYYITGEAKEGRFGIEEQPKFWVKYCIDLADGSRKILKLVFHEQFTTNLGMFTVRCVRDPDKESRILDKMAGDDRFMQGRTVHDKVGNNVRILEYIRGKSLFEHVALLKQPHEEYFHETLPGILKNILGCIEAMECLHRQGEQHGDIRNDHILIESRTGRYRWIDFDYAVNFLDYDIWAMGNILNYAVGKGINTCSGFGRPDGSKRSGGAEIEEDDALLFYPYRLANLHKVYPYIPPEMNDMLLRFAAGATDFYEGFGRMADDLRALIA